MSTNKETLIQREVYSIVATCLKIANENPRAPAGTVSPLVKPVRSFSTFLDALKEDEVIAMAKTFYTEYYMNAMGSDTWIDGDIALVIGDDVDNVRLRVSQYARVAKEMKHNEYDTLSYHCTRLIRHMASKVVGENLDERLLPLEKKLGKGAAGAGAGGVAAALSNSFGGLGSIGETLMAVVKPMIDSFTNGGDGESSLQTMLANPQNASMLRAITNTFPSNVQEHLEPMIDDMQNGRFDVKTVLEKAARAIGAGGDNAGQAAAPLVALVRNEPEPLDDGEPSLSTSDVIIPTLPDAYGGECTNDVCYPYED